MKPTPHIYSVLYIFAAASFSALAGQPATFSPIAPLPAGALYDAAREISPDGLSVYGETLIEPGNTENWVWSAKTGHITIDQLVNHGNHIAIYEDISNTQRVVGFAFLFNTEENIAISWTPESGIETLPQGPSDELAFCVSADGSTIGGSVGPTAAKWTETEGWTLLDGHPPGLAHDVSSDGTAFVGMSARLGPLDNYNFIWTQDAGPIQINPPKEASFFRPRKISGDGSTLIGALHRDHPDFRPAKWTNLTGFSPLPLPATVSGDTLPLAISGDGSVIVGRSQTTLSHRYQAVIWDNNGVHILQDMLTAAGADLAGWHLFEASGISDDGLTFIGNGYDTNGTHRGWIATLPPADPSCNPSDIAEPFGELNFFDVSAFLAAFSANDPIADMNADGLFNFFDVSDFLATFSSGCP